MRKLLLVLFTVLVALVSINAVRRALATDETRIRWLLEGMADGFDDASAGRAVEGLAGEWRDAESGVDRAWLAEGLRQFFQRQRLAGSGAPRYRVELPRESLAIELDPEEPARAHLECLARFLDLGQEERVAWEVAIEAELERRDPGWRIVRTRHRTLSGRSLARGF